MFQPENIKLIIEWQNSPLTQHVQTLDVFKTSQNVFGEVKCTISTCNRFETHLALYIQILYIKQLGYTNERSKYKRMWGREWPIALRGSSQSLHWANQRWGFFFLFSSMIKSKRHTCLKLIVSYYSDPTTHIILLDTDHNVNSYSLA